MPTSLNADMYDENALGEHESELDRMKGFYRDHIDLLKLITKREDLWKKMLEAEARANDPNRFYQNRGGQLLKEEKMRKKVEKDLPKVSKVCRSCPVCGGGVCVCMCALHLCMYMYVHIRSLTRPPLRCTFVQVESDLRKMLQEWEEDHDRVFEVHDARYIDTMDAQWVHFREEKDQQKAMRVRHTCIHTYIEVYIHTFVHVHNFL